MTKPYVRPGYHADLLESRFVVLTDRKWMETYHNWEDLEARVRLQVRRENGPGLLLWLKCLKLFRDGFNRSYSISSDLSEAEIASLMLRLDFIGLAGSTSKMVLDGLIAGYYAQSLMLSRHMLESYRRIMFIRLSVPDDIWRWYPKELIPMSVKSEPDFSHNSKIPDYNEIRTRVLERGDAEDHLSFERSGGSFEYTRDYHAHPTLEGATQLFYPDIDGKRTFGPTYLFPHFLRGFKIGMTANLLVLVELLQLNSQTDEWQTELKKTSTGFRAWLAENQQLINQMPGDETGIPQ